MTLRELIHTIYTTFHIVVDFIKTAVEFIKVFAKGFWNALLDAPLWLFGVAIGVAVLGGLIKLVLRKRFGINWWGDEE